MYSKKAPLGTDEFEKSGYAKKTQLTVECAYCGHKSKAMYDIETAENKKRHAITWKCPKCGNYCRLWDFKLHRLEEQI